MTNLDALRALQELFADPRRWTRLRRAANASGLEVDPTDPEASCWCFSGGIDKVAGPDEYLADTLIRRLSRVSWKRNCGGIIHTNDHLGLDAVRLVIADAIAEESRHAD